MKPADEGAVRQERVGDNRVGIAAAPRLPVGQTIRSWLAIEVEDRAGRGTTPEDVAVVRIALGLSEALSGDIGLVPDSEGTTASCGIEGEDVIEDLIVAAGVGNPAVGHDEQSVACAIEDGVVDDVVIGRIGEADAGGIGSGVVGREAGGADDVIPDRVAGGIQFQKNARSGVAIDQALLDQVIHIVRVQPDARANVVSRLVKPDGG